MKVMQPAIGKTEIVCQTSCTRIFPPLTVRVSRSRQRGQFVTSERDFLAIVEPSVGIGTGVLANHAKCARQQLLQIAGSGDVVSMAVSVECEPQCEAKFFDQSGVTRRFLEHCGEKILVSVMIELSKIKIIRR